MNPKDLVGSSKAPLRYVPPALMIEASGPMEDGAMKYGPFNWREQPVEMVTYLEAAIRHLLAVLDGQDFAEDSGHSHIGHAISGLGIIADAKANGTLIDNRFAPGPAADMLRARDKSQRMDSSEPKLYANMCGIHTFVPTSVCGCTPEPGDIIEFTGMGGNTATVTIVPEVESWGEGDGDLIYMYKNIPVEAEDGCVVYLGKHVHPSVATPATFRDMDREYEKDGQSAKEYRPSMEF